MHLWQGINIRVLNAFSSQLKLLKAVPVGREGPMQCYSWSDPWKSKKANMLLWWTLRTVIVAGRKRVVTCSLPDPASAQFFLYKITALPAVGESGKSNLFLKQPLHFPFVPRECNAVLRSLDLVCIFYCPVLTYVCLWETVWSISIYSGTGLWHVIMNWMSTWSSSIYTSY